MRLDRAGSVRLALLSGVVALTLLALISGLGLRLNNQAHAATSNVNVGQTNGGGGEANEYNSADLTIAEGDTVEFDWYGGVHDVTSYAGGDGTPDWATSSFMLSPGTYSKTFATAGVVTYYCTIHADWADAAPGVIDANIAAGKMVGKVTVEAAAADTPTATETTTPTDPPAEATMTPTTSPTATSTEESPAETPGDATATTTPTATATEAAVEATPTATETSELATATNTPSNATATDVPAAATPTDAHPTATATEEPAATSEPTATQPAPPQQPRTVNVEAGNEWFGDASFQNGSFEITINAGDTVQWNLVEGVHTAYECGASWSRANNCAGATWNSEILQAGDIYSQRFASPGTYYYLCTLHPLTMRGVVAVEGNVPPNTGAPTASSPGPTAPSPGNPSVSSPPPNSNLPTGLANSGYGPLSQESARPDSPLGRATIIAAATVALLAAASVWKEVAWRTRN